MALTTTTRAGTGPRRRTLLAGGAAVLLAGCSGGRQDGAADERARAEERLRARAGRDSTALLAAYDATIAAHAGLAGRLRPLRAEVARHAEAFGSSAPSAPPSSSAPRDAKAALAALADAERRTADDRAAALGSASPELARLLASVAAAGAAHAYLLGVEA
ncbi:hypothetical protein I5Q34_07055 [Streptomyces sp. AV19]|uniref:hypothetical protein n=1 Tax=Streptomyces sp. AV19 TaxID=2793068 RepID=UPI0018FE834E|nr:hypothetical protein [Streptomyces sp. AV19]MBH1934052.1 hypothetical protein [Streptomyces sp. AV19]MDG4535467.1 hypothetical protein [Streptomyces sp. AV19]